MPGQATGGTRRLLLTVAVFRPWRDSQGFAAPGLPGREQAYPMERGVSNELRKRKNSVPFLEGIRKFYFRKPASIHPEVELQDS